MKTKEIARGRCSVIYEYTPGTVLKLYDEKFPEEIVEKEFHNTLLVYKLGTLGVPQPLEITKKDRKYGIVF